MIGRDGVDRAIGESAPDRFDVVAAAQWWVDLVERVVGGSQLVGEQQMMRRDLGGDIHAARLRPPHEFDRSRRGDVADVQPRTDVLCQQDVARDDRFFRNRRPAP